jgi:hypothetical protein
MSINNGDKVFFLIDEKIRSGILKYIASGFYYVSDKEEEFKIYPSKIFKTEKELCVFYMDDIIEKNRILNNEIKKLEKEHDNNLRIAEKIRNRIQELTYGLKKRFLSKNIIVKCGEECCFDCEYREFRAEDGLVCSMFSKITQDNEDDMSTENQELKTNDVSGQTYRCHQCLEAEAEEKHNKANSELNCPKNCNCGI